MSLHVEFDNEPLLVFTRDFREFVRGWFHPGHHLTIRYDPFRIVPPDDDYQFGDPARPIRAHIRFREGGQVLELPLESHVGLVQGARSFSTARAAMLQAELDIPEDAEWLSAWFSYRSPSGQVHYDSSFGKNFLFRFYSAETRVLVSEVREAPGQSTDLFVLRVAAAAPVSGVVARYRITNRPSAAAAVNVELHRTDKVDERGRPIWETRDVAVPRGAVVAFDLIYLYPDRRVFKDDNQGNFFLAYGAEAARRLRRDDSRQ